MNKLLWPELGILFLLVIGAESGVTPTLSWLLNKSGKFRNIADNFAYCMTHAESFPEFPPDSFVGRKLKSIRKSMDQMAECGILTFIVCGPANHLHATANLGMILVSNPLLFGEVIASPSKCGAMSLCLTGQPFSGCVRDRRKEIENKNHQQSSPSFTLDLSGLPPPPGLPGFGPPFGPGAMPPFGPVLIAPMGPGFMPPMGPGFVPPMGSPFIPPIGPNFGPPMGPPLVPGSNVPMITMEFPPAGSNGQYYPSTNDREFWGSIGPPPPLPPNNNSPNNQPGGQSFMPPFGQGQGQRLPMNPNQMMPISPPSNQPGPNGPTIIVDIPPPGSGGQYNPAANNKDLWGPIGPPPPLPFPSNDNSQNSRPGGQGSMPPFGQGQIPPMGSLPNLPCVPGSNGPTIIVDLAQSGSNGQQNPATSDKDHLRPIGPPPPLPPKC